MNGCRDRILAVQALSSSILLQIKRNKDNYYRKQNKTLENERLFGGS